jgi:SAM-dependent methyltransferase
VSRKHGWERGRPIDRYYIERFLERHKSDVRGRVLDVFDRRYSSQFGGADVTSVDVLHLVEGNPEATIVSDLANSDAFSADTFDCVLLTQTLQLIFDLPAAVRSVHKMLRPDGVVLATVPTVSPIVHDKADAWQDLWRLTSDAARRIFSDVFHPDNVQVEAHGNVLSALAFLEGLSSTELTAEELDQADPMYEVLVTIRAVKR